MGRATLPKLNRNSNSRKNLFKAQLRDLVAKGKITTTVTKAKILKRLFDKLVSRAQDGTLSARRAVAADLSSPKAANKVVDVIAPLMSDRKSGFTSIQKVAVRRGDATPMATISLIKDLPIEAPKVKEDKKAKKEVKAKEAKKVTKETK